MSDEELVKWDKRKVAATLRDGHVLRGTFNITPEVGLYNIFPLDERLGVIQHSGALDDLYAEDFVVIESL